MPRITVHDEPEQVPSKLRGNFRRAGGRASGVRARRRFISLLAAVCAVIVAWASGPVLAQSASDLPERLRRQVAPAPSAPWRAPDLHVYSNALKLKEQGPIDPARQYDLTELIDVALR